MAGWYEVLSFHLKLIWLQPSKADPDLWMKDSEDHYEDITVYSDERFVFIKDTTGIFWGFNTLLPLQVVGYP